MDFIPFDPWAHVEIYEGNLPHWQQKGCTHFITWRTEDSIPASFLRQWNQARDIWLRVHEATPETLERLPPEKLMEYHSRFTTTFHNELDRGHGACLLRKPAARKITEQALLFFDGERYEMGDFVVMPNHVHFLVRLKEGITIKEQCFSWKRFTSGEINRLTGRRGVFWQSESYDHIVRSLEALRTIQNYIANNPVKAGLREGEYTLYQPAGWM